MTLFFFLLAAARRQDGERAVGGSRRRLGRLPARQGVRSVFPGASERRAAALRPAVLLGVRARPRAQRTARRCPAVGSFLSFTVRRFNVTPVLCSLRSTVHSLADPRERFGGQMKTL